MGRWSMAEIVIVVLAMMLPFLTISSSSSALVLSGGFHQACRGTIGECMLEEEELEDEEFEMMDSRRILATRRYISYGALKRNTVPCSRRGASYYNCRRGAQANPYSRGCSAITRCRR